MGIIVTIIVGFIVGLLARAIKPGNDNLGIIWTTVLGIAGAALAGFIGQGLGWYSTAEPAGWIASILGAVLLLVIVQALTGRRSHHGHTV